MFYVSLQKSPRTAAGVQAACCSTHFPVVAERLAQRICEIGGFGYANTTTVVCFSPTMVQPPCGGCRLLPFGEAKMLEKKYIT